MINGNGIVVIFVFAGCRRIDVRTLNAPLILIGTVCELKCHRYHRMLAEQVILNPTRRHVDVDLGILRITVESGIVQIERQTVFKVIDERGGLGEP